VNAASEAKSGISTTKPDTYVIINGVRKRLTDDVTALRHQQPANQRNTTTLPGGGIKPWLHVKHWTFAKVFCNKCFECYYLRQRDYVIPNVYLFIALLVS